MSLGLSCVMSLFRQVMHGDFFLSYNFVDVTFDLYGSHVKDKIEVFVFFLPFSGILN